jgi:Na+/H+ antiporter NhaB
VADPRQELRRQLRVVRRNPHLIAALFLLHSGLLPTGDDLDFAAALQLHRERARLRTRHLAAQAQDLQLATVAHNSQRERPKEASPTSRAAGAIARTASPASGTLLARGNALP